MERINELHYKKEDGDKGKSLPDVEEPFFNSPAEFLVQQMAKHLLRVPQWKTIFGENIDFYKREDYSMRALPALRIYNEITRKEYESWWVFGDIKADMILPAVLRRQELQQVQDTLSSALLQQFRRPVFFDAMNAVVPGLNELGKAFSIDKTLGFEWETQWVPLTQIVINFRIDLRIWDDYLEATDRTKDSPFERVLANLTTIAGQIQGLQDDLETVDVSLGVTQTPGTGTPVQGDE